MLHPAMAVLTWDPQLRGALIVLLAVVVLPGSAFLLLSTNVGIRLGFLLAVAGLSGWLLALNIVWLAYGIGYKGSTNGWIVKEIDRGSLVEHSALKAVVGTPGKPQTQFPHGWTPLPAGNSVLAPAAPVADNALIPPAPGAAPTSAFPAPFHTTQDYAFVGAYSKGGRNYLLNLFGYKVYWRIRHHQMYIKHQPHYLVYRVQAALPSVTLAGAAATLPAPDVTAPIYSVVMERDVGSLRLPPTLLGLAAGIVFGLVCEKLHSRDAEIARRRAAEDQGAGRGPSGVPRRELQPA